jgi:hypothetical protein
MMRRVFLRGLLGASLVAVGYGAFNYWGPYRWLAELSLSLFGAYEPRLVFLLSLLSWLVPPLLLSALFDPPSAKRGAAATTAAARAATQARLQRIQNWLVLGAVGALFLVLGGREVLAARAGSTLTHTTCASIEAGVIPKGTWLELECEALASARLDTSEGYAQRAYVPLVSDTWSKKKPLSAVLKFDPEHAPDLRARSFTGGIASEDLPGMVRAAYEAEGVEAPHALVLTLGRVPKENLSRGAIMAAAGLLALLAGSFLSWRGWSP